jgi:hypothetical protein
MSEATTTTVGGAQLPSERDWALYQAVRVEQWPTRAAAEGFGISQTRVCQIVQRTATFVAQAVTVPTKAEEAQQLAAGKQLAADRIDYLYGQAMSCFRYSKEASNGKNGCTTGRRSYGDMRYLNAAARFALIASTLPLPRQCWMGDVAEEPASEPKAERAKPTSRTSKPAETCSAPPTEQPVPAAAEPSPSDATAAAMLGCVEASRDDKGSATTNARPVQPDVRRERGAPAVTKQEAKRRAFFQIS